MHFQSQGILHIHYLTSSSGKKKNLALKNTSNEIGQHVLEEVSVYMCVCVFKIGV